MADLRATGGGRAAWKTIERIKGLNAVTALVDNTHQPAVIVYSGLTAQHFKLCAAVAGAAEIYRFTRPLGFEYMDCVVADLEAHWSGSDGRDFSFRASMDDDVQEKGKKTGAVAC